MACVRQSRRWLGGPDALADERSAQRRRRLLVDVCAAAATVARKTSDRAQGHIK